MEPSDKQVWEDFEKRVCLQFGLSLDAFYAILIFAFGDVVKTSLQEKQYSLLLNFSANEIYKAIRRVKPKLGLLEELKDLRRRFKEQPNSLESLYTSGEVVKVLGVWKQKFK